MSQIPMSIATKLNPSCVEKAKKAFAEIANHKSSEMRDYMQRMGNMQCYHAWIQTVPIGDWLIEYWESELSFNDFEAALQSPTTEFDHWFKTLRAELTNDGLKQIKGFRKLIDYQLQDGTLMPASCRSYLVKQGYYCNIWIKSNRFLGCTLMANKLYPSEIETLYWAARGKTSEETAIILKLSPNTITSYRKQAIQKLNASNITHAVFLAAQLGLIAEH